jgi:hypothetical protein
LLNAKTTVRSSTLRSNNIETVPSGRSHTTFARNARRAARITLVARHASASAGNTTGADHIAKAATINATTIYAMSPTVDWDATDATNTTINQNAETEMVEAIAGRDAKATSVERRRTRSRGKKNDHKKGRHDDRDQRESRD